jgi:hypothetical protein
VIITTNIVKGAIFRCLRELVLKEFGEDVWKKALEKSGLNKDLNVPATGKIEDEVILSIVQNLSEILNVSLQDLADAFGDYWVNTYSQRVYKVFYDEAEDAKSYILKLDRIHWVMTRNIPDARPPRFDYEWKDDKTLIMKYKSHRNLIDFAVGLLKGVRRYYNEDFDVSKLDDKTIEIKFKE